MIAVANRRKEREQAEAALEVLVKVEAAARRDPSPDTILRTVRRDVDLLTVATYATTLGRTSRTGVTVPPLLSDLRDSIRSDQGGPSGKGSTSGARFPFDADAVDIYSEIRESVETRFSGATDEKPSGTPEQLLRAWLLALEVEHAKGNVTLVQLMTQAKWVHQLRRRIEDKLNPPRVSEDPLCPVCGYTHREVVVDGEVILQRCLVRMVWPEHLGRAPRAECRHCGARWVGVHRSPQHPDRPSLSDLDDQLEQNLTDYGAVERTVAFLPGDTDA